jgi:hypothetical protein
MGLGIALLIFIFVVLMIPFIYGALLIVMDLPHQLSWREYTAPLNSKVVQDLCQKFNLGDQDPRCKPGATVYAPDFFQTIRHDFIHSNGERVNYRYVQEKIGKYQYECGPIIKESTGFEYFRCGYDLQGDRVFPIGINFDSEGNLLEYFASTSD